MAGIVCKTVWVAMLLKLVGAEPATRCGRWVDRGGVEGSLLEKGGR